MSELAIFMTYLSWYFNSFDDIQFFRTFSSISRDIKIFFEKFKYLQSQYHGSNLHYSTDFGLNTEIVIIISNIGISDPYITGSGNTYIHV